VAAAAAAADAGLHRKGRVWGAYKAGLRRSKMLRGRGAGTSSRYAYTLLDDHRQYKV